MVRPLFKAIALLQINNENYLNLVSDKNLLFFVSKQKLPKMPPLVKYLRRCIAGNWTVVPRLVLTTMESILPR
ncbi:MAG: hypothetical protein ACI87J_001248 [Colwellia sp.]|jgi:hypothetical protein